MSYESEHLTIAVEEEIGEPELFVGRQRDLDFFLRWIELARKKIGQSQVILARKRRGKTALVQRLYNILYSRNDPEIIPFYFRVPEGVMTTLEYSKLFMEHLFSQILGYLQRNPDLIRRPLDWAELEEPSKNIPAMNAEYKRMTAYIAEDNPMAAWELAREAGHHLSMVMNVRIIQILDEFQYLNHFIYRDDTLTVKHELATFYQKTGSSKVSPQIITGSYIGWLTRIVNHMVGRYAHYYLKSLPDDEALTCVYRYASIYGQKISDASAPYIAAVCYNDPFYIACMFAHDDLEKDLCDETSIRSTMEALTEKGGLIDNMWGEYIGLALQKVNDRVAKKAILYLAHHDPEDRTCDQMIEDLNLSLTREQLAERLNTLAQADLINKVSDIRFKGLGDPVFAMVFRKIFAESIQDIKPEQIKADIDEELKVLRGKVSYYKGVAAEARMSARVIFMGMDRRRAADVFYGAPSDLELRPFVSAYSHVFQLSEGKRIAVDLFAKTRNEGPDLIFEVKDWKKPPGRQEIDTFVALKKRLEPHLERPTHFVFHSEEKLSDEIRQYILEQGLWHSDGETAGNS